MQKTGRSLLFIIIAVLLFKPALTSGQALPEILTTGTVKEQIDYVSDRTRIYDNFRAVREDMFQAITKNALDTLASTRSDILLLTGEGRKLNLRIDSLKRLLGDTRNELEEITKNKNSIEVMGVMLNKTTYNLMMWGLAGVLIMLLIIGWLSFKRSLVITRDTKKELEELQKYVKDSEK